MDFQQRHHSGKSLLNNQDELSLSNKIQMSNDVYKESFQIADDFYYCLSDCNGSQADVKLAGMKIFSSVMLNAWRKRRDDVKRLSEEIKRMKKFNLKTKNQIHVISSLFKVEQKQNDDLNNRLKRTYEELKRLENVYEKLNDTFLELETKHKMTKYDLEEKLKENNLLSETLDEMKTELTNVISRKNDLKELCIAEQKKALQLESEKSELIAQKDKLQRENEKKDVDMRNAILEKEKEITNCKLQMNKLESKLYEFKKMETELIESKANDISQRQEIQELTEKINVIENSLERTILKRVSTVFDAVPTKTLFYAYSLAYQLLPAVPARGVFSIPLCIDAAINHFIQPKMN